MLVRDPETGKIMGPYPLVTWGRGYACVSTEKCPGWILSKNIRPFHESLPQSSGEDSDHPPDHPLDHHLDQQASEPSGITNN